LATEVIIWSIAASSFLIVGALVGWWAELPARIIASLLAFGGGILISVSAFELLDEAHRAAGLMPVIVGYVCGAMLFAFGLRALDRAGARWRKRTPSGAPLGSAAAAGGIIALATVLDGIPESLFIGLNI
jgi:ZIP family zinc transporter